MFKKPNKKTFRLNTIIDGHIISGKVAFSPAPEPGIFTELAKFEARRILEQMVKEEIASAGPALTALSECGLLRRRL